MGNSIWRLAIATILVAALALIGRQPAVAQDATLPQIIDKSGQPVPGSIVALQKVNLGGFGQWILIRGRDETKPVLLVLHGGPGAALMPWVDLFQPSELEANFVVVHWDQRGAGKSYSSALSDDRLSIETYVDDTLELANLLRRRFKQDKIFLTGISWGSALGFLTLERDATPFKAFIAAGERVNWQRGQQMAFEWVKAQAEAAKDAEALAKIAKIEPFDASSASDLLGKDQLLERFRGGDLSTPGLWQQYLDYATNGQSPYYSMPEVKNYIPGMKLSQNAILPQAQDYNLFEDFPESPIPVHFVNGADDHQTPVELVQEYAEALKAPDKSLTIIESAGHNVVLDAPKAWATTLIRIAKETPVD